MATTTDSARPPVGDSPTGTAVPAPLDRGALNLPNLITLSRLGLAVLLFVLIDQNGFWVSSAVLFVVAAATDALDGYIARRYGMVTTLGRILDPFADKIIVGGAFIFLLDKKVNLADGNAAWSGVNAWMVIAVIGREMFVTSMRGFLEKHGYDFSADWAGKSKMLLQCLAVTASLLSLSPEVLSAFPAFPGVRDVLLWLAVGVTLYSGFSYVMRAAAMLRNAQNDAPRQQPTAEA